MKNRENERVMSKEFLKINWHSEEKKIGCFLNYDNPKILFGLSFFFPLT